MAWLSIVLASCALGSQGESPERDTPPRFGVPLAELRELATPSDVAIDHRGRLFAVETRAHRVRAWTLGASEVRALAEFGDEDDVPGGLLEPRGLGLMPPDLERPAAEQATELLVCDAGNGRVVWLRLGAEGFELVAELGARGRKTGELLHPVDVASDGERVFVADAGLDRVAVFATDGSFIEAFQTGFRAPASLICEPGGGVLISDPDASRVVRFGRDPAGGWSARAAFGEHGPFEGLLADPRGIALDAGRIYVAERGNHRVQVFAATEALSSAPATGVLYSWGRHAIRPREGAGKLHYPAAVAIDPRHRFAALAEPFEDRIQLFGPLSPGQDPAPYAPDPLVGGGPDGGGIPHYGERLASHGELVALLDPEAARVTVCDLDAGYPVAIHQLGRRGSRPGEFTRPVDVAFDRKSGELLVLDRAARRIARFALDHDASEPLKQRMNMSRLVASVDLSRLAAGGEEGTLVAFDPRVIDPLALERDAQGRTWLVDARTEQVVAFDERWQPVLAAGAGVLRGPTDLAFGPGERELWVVDRLNRCVRAFDAQSGALRATIGEHGDGPGRFQEPFGVASDAAGRLFVTDVRQARLHVFERDGGVAARGGPGIGAGEFFKPKGVVVDFADRVIVVDYGNHRGQVFDPAGAFQRAFGARLFVRPTEQRSPRAPRRLPD